MHQSQPSFFAALLRHTRLLLCVFVCVSMASMHAVAASNSHRTNTVTSATTSAIVSGNFVYEQEGDGSLLQYHVDKVNYQGIPAWQVSWDCEQLSATHYLRRSDGQPLYVKRINHVLKRTVEIHYSHDPKIPTTYLNQSENERLERKIWNTELQDLGALPQMLVRAVQAQAGAKTDNIHFSAINYDDGKVYQLVAKHMGFRRVSTDGVSVRCAIYDVKLDSWLSSFVSKTRLLIPLQQGSSNFVTYNGPGLDSVSDAWSLRLVGKSSSLAMATPLPN